MKICVNGWYFERNLFSNTFKKISEDYEITVVTYHQRANGSIVKEYDELPIPEVIDSYVKESGVTHYKIPVAGLEWGGYDFYLKNIWDRQSNILFMHDDIVIYNSNVFDIIKQELKDYFQAFIFRDEVEELANGRIHGRGVYCSKDFLQFALDYSCTCKQAFDHEHPHHLGQEPKVMLEGTGPHTGIWYDPYNLGIHTQGKVPQHCRHYNAGVYHFASFAGRTSYTNSPWPGFPKDKVRVAVHFPDFNSGRRGLWTGKIYGRGENLGGEKMSKQNERDNLSGDKGSPEVSIEVSKEE